MPIREDERALRAEGDVQYCVICKRYFSADAWRGHEHNPAVQSEQSIRRLDELTADVMYLGPIKVSNCASVLVIGGVEVFRLRDRDGENRIRMDLDVRGPNDARIALVQDNFPKLLAPGYRFQLEGAVGAVVDGSGTPLVKVESMSSKSLRVTGTFWFDSLRVTATATSLTVGETTVREPEVRGKGTAIVMRKKPPFVSFANR